MVRVDRRLQERLTRRRVITRVIISALILLSISLLFISRTNDARFAPLRNKIEGMMGPVAAGVSLPFRKIVNFGQYLGRLRTIEEDNKRLRNENANLKAYKFSTQALKSKIERLETMMDVQPGLDIPQSRKAVRVMTETRGPFAYSVLINSGQKGGVKAGYPVMHETGLMGHVIRVGATSSRVLLLEDLNSRISVMSQESEARAVLIGKNDQPPQLAFFDDASKWKDGAMVITSGDDGVLPQGLPIGQVIHDDKNDIRVSLLKRGSADWVWVYPFEALETPEDDPSRPSDEDQEDDEVQTESEPNDGEDQP